MTSYCPVPGVGPTSPADNGYQGGFAAALMLKDLRWRWTRPRPPGASPPMGQQAKELYEAFDEPATARSISGGSSGRCRGGLGLASAFLRSLNHISISEPSNSSSSGTASISCETTSGGVITAATTKIATIT